MVVFQWKEPAGANADAPVTKPALPPSRPEPYRHWPPGGARRAKILHFAVVRLL